MTNDRIKKLQQEIEKEREKINRCSHDWGSAYYDPTTKNVPVGVKMEARGSDVWPVADGWTTETVDQWSRRCKKCGCVESTQKKRPVQYEPEFEPKF